MLRWYRLFKFGRLLFKNLDTRKEQDAVLYYVMNNVSEEGKFSVPEWSHIGSMLGVLGK